MTVGRRVDDGASADHAARAGLVVDDDRMTESLGRACWRRRGRNNPRTRRPGTARRFASGETEIRRSAHVREPRRYRASSRTEATRQSSCSRGAWARRCLASCSPCNVIRSFRRAPRHRLGTIGLLLELEDLDGIVPENQLPLRVGELCVIDHFQPQLVQRGRNADPTPRRRPIGAEEDAVRADLVDRNTQVLGSSCRRRRSRR